MIEELRLDRDVEAAGRLVRDQELGAGAHGHGNEHALGHARGKLVRVGLHPPLRIVDADELQHFDGPGVGGLAAHAVVRAVDVLDLPSHRQHRMERGARALHDEADIPAADRIELCVAHGQQVAAQIVHFARDDAAGRAHQPHHRDRRRRLAAAGLAHDADELAGADGERKVLHRDVLGALAAGKRHGEAAHRENLARAVGGDVLSLDAHSSRNSASMVWPTKA